MSELRAIVLQNKAAMQVAESVGRQKLDPGSASYGRERESSLSSFDERGNEASGGNENSRDSE